MTKQKAILQYSYLLDEERRVLFKKRKFAYPDAKSVQAQASKCKEWWDEVNKNNQILDKISEVTGVSLAYPLKHL